MKLKIDTPMASAPIDAAESSPQWPAMEVETMPISGTVMFETMLGRAMRSISRFMFMAGTKIHKFRIKATTIGRFALFPGAFSRCTE